MLNLLFKPHRAALHSGTVDEQKLFAMLKVIPNADVAKARPPLAFALVIDTSGSMREFADQEQAVSMIQSQGVLTYEQTTGDGSSHAAHLNLPTKLEQAIRAAHAFIADSRLKPEDQISLIHFDDNAKSLLRLSPLLEKEAIIRAINSLPMYSGGTHIAKGLNCAERELSSVPSTLAKRVLLLTDGQTFDEPKCRPMAGRLAEANAPIIAIGVGVEYNEDLLRDLADLSRGRPYHLAKMEQFHDVLNDEIGSSVREVVTDLQVSVSTVKGVKLNSITRVYPSLSEVGITDAFHRLGNIPAGDYSAFILEFTISGVVRPPSRVRIAQVGLTGHVPALDRRDELPPQDLFVTFTTDDQAVSEVDAEVLGYVQQKNVDRMVQDAVKVAGTDAVKARQTLQAAVGMTQRIGNAAMTRLLQSALDELNQSGTISVGTRKTVAMGGRTKTVKTGAGPSLEGLPSEADIRKMTGA
jgi:Ca-activated chloride channel family protein